MTKGHESCISEVTATGKETHANGKLLTNPEGVGKVEGPYLGGRV